MQSTTENTGSCPAKLVKIVDTPNRVLLCLINRLIRGSDKSRAQIAEKMSERLGERVSIHMLNASTAPSRGARFPAAWVSAFCEVVGDDRPTRLVMGPRLAGLVQLGEALVELREIDPKTQRLVRRLQRRGHRNDGGDVTSSLCALRELLPELKRLVRQAPAPRRKTRK